MIKNGQDALLKVHNQVEDSFRTLAGFRVLDFSPNLRQESPWLRGSGVMANIAAEVVLRDAWIHSTVSYLKIDCPDSWSLEGFFLVDEVECHPTSLEPLAMEIKIRACQKPKFQNFFSEPS